MTRIVKTALDNFLASKQQQDDAEAAHQQRTNARNAAVLDLRRLVEEHGGESKAVIVDGKMVQLVGTSIAIYDAPKVVQ